MREPRVYPRPYSAYDSNDMHLHGQGDDEPFEQSFVLPRAHSSDSANPQPNTIPRVRNAILHVSMRAIAPARLVVQ
jgi:hypothetical protein